MLKICFTNIWDDFEQATPCPWDIVEFSITHQEGHIAKASLMVGNFTPPLGSYIGIFENDTLLFQGMVSGQFEHYQHLTKIDVLCISPTFEQDLETLLASISLPYKADFFQGKAKNPSDYLEADNKLFYWDKTSGKIALSDYFQGARCVDVRGLAIEKSFKIQQIAMPLGRVVVDLKVHWTQHLSGSFNAAPYIAKTFPEKVIATLTPDAITNHWPLEDQRLGLGRRKSGYRVEYSKVAPLNGHGLRLYTKPIYTKVNGEEKRLHAKIHYFKTSLKIHWQYNQPRMEHMVIHGQLNHCQHQFTKHRVRHIPILIELPNSKRAMFFETQQGHDFVDYAKRIATSQLKASARCINVLCTLPWHLGCDLTINDSLKTEREFIGKITKIRQVVKGLQRFVEVTVGCVTQTGDLTNCSANNRYDDDFVDDDIESADALQGIAYQKLNPKDMLKSISVKNSASEQETYLLQNQHPVRDNMAAVLQEVPTSIHIELRDLRTDKPLIRHFEKRLPVVEVPDTII